MATISASPQVVSDRLRRPRLSVNFQATRAATLPPAPAQPVEEPQRLRDIDAVRWASAIASVFVLALAGFVMAPHSTASAPAVTSSTGPVVAESMARPAWTVAPGDTLWSIATQVSAGEDPREVVMQLQQINGFGPGHVLQVGEVVLVMQDRPLGRS